MYTLFTFEWIDKISIKIQFKSNYQKWTGVKVIYKMYFLQYDLLPIINTMFVNNNNDTLLQIHSKNQFSICSDPLIDI